MLTNKITGFSADLLNTVRSILGEAKKCGDCGCEQCECEDAEEVKEDYVNNAQRKAVWANRADGGAGHPDKKKKKMKEEGYMPTSDEPTAANKKTADRVRAMLAKEKKPVKETADMPFAKPYKKVSDRKDEYGNIVKNVAKHLAKKAMNKQKNEEVEQVDETSKPGYFRVSIPNKATTYHNADHAAHARELAQNHHDNPPAEVAARRRDDYKNLNFSKASVRRLGDKVNLKSKFSKEEVEQVDELKRETVRTYYNKAIAQGKPIADKMKMGGGDHSSDGSDTKTLRKRAAGVTMALKRRRGEIKMSEEAEGLDEISKATMGRYINKAKDSIDTAAYRQGNREALGGSSRPLERKLSKRHKGISTAVKKLTKEEQDFIDSLNNEIFEKADPYDVVGMIKKAKAKNDPNHPAMKHVAAIEDIKKHGGALSVHGDHVRSLIKALGEEVQIEEGEEKGGGYDGMPKGLEDRAPRGRARNAMGRAIARKERNLARARMNRAAEMKKEEVELDEARGRPRKAGAKDFTIHPKTKEKLMHDNPADMKRIEALQKNGILEKPKVEANQHVINQLQKAKLSMKGGTTINFTHGDSKEVSGTHAAKILTKYAGMRPNEKEAFQKDIGHSHARLMKHV